MLAAMLGGTIGFLLGMFAQRISTSIRTALARIQKREIIDVLMFRPGGQVKKLKLPILIKGGMPVVEWNNAYYEISADALWRGSGPTLVVTEGVATPLQRETLLQKGRPRFSATEFYRAINANVVQEIMHSLETKETLMIIVMCAVTLGIVAVMFVLIQQQGRLLKQIATVIREIVAPPATALIAPLLPL